MDSRGKPMTADDMRRIAGMDENERLRAALEGVDRVVMAALRDRSKHDVEILLGYLMGLHSHVEEALAALDNRAPDGSETQ